MNFIGVIILLTVFTMGCAPQLEDYVRNGPKASDGLEQPSTSTSNALGIKMSPGANMAEGSAIKGRFAITTSQKPLEGTQLKARISFHLNR